jgi:hypothetical protein
MLTARPLLRSLRAAAARPTCSTFFSTVAKPAEDEDALSPAAERREKMRTFDRHMVWGTTGEDYMPAPVLPENPAEIAALDSAQEQSHNTHMDGTLRTVVIRQQKKSARQAPLNPEDSWKLFFYEDGTYAEKWTNSLMGWTSNADPYQCAPPLTFENAQDAVYFCKKRGWNFVVKRPITRYMRNDDAQYQDNFLPQAVARKIKMEGKSCEHWHRASSWTSHYFRPLNFHGDGEQSQFGPNADAPIAPAPEGFASKR